MLASLDAPPPPPVKEALALLVRLLLRVISAGAGGIGMMGVYGTIRHHFDYGDASFTAVLLLIASTLVLVLSLLSAPQARRL
jgi:hypothetical protein